MRELNADELNSVQGGRNREPHDSNKRGGFSGGVHRRLGGGGFDTPEKGGISGGVKGRLGCSAR